MVPLPDALKTQTIAAAATIEAQAGKTATITTTLSSGAHSLVAVFTPTDPRSFSGSVSLPVSYVVNAATGPVATTTTLTGSPSPAVPIILRATVVPASAVSTVEFTDGTTALGGPVPVIGGVAAVFTPVLTPGPHSLIATFTPHRPDRIRPVIVGTDVGAGDCTVRADLHPAAQPPPVPPRRTAPLMTTGTWTGRRESNPPGQLARPKSSPKNRFSAVMVACIAMLKPFTGTASRFTAASPREDRPISSAMHLAKLLMITLVTS